MAGNNQLGERNIYMPRPKVKRLEWKGTALCPGSCGELVQGTWNGINFLVPCPIDLYSLAQVTLHPNTPLTGPSDKPKALEAVRRTLAWLGCEELGGEIRVSSQIPQGKGMASSTADIGAVIAATAAALGVHLPPRELAELAVSIEPTDGTILPGITLFDHVQGRWRLPLGQGPHARILVVDLGGQVDTLEFNALPGLDVKNRQNEAVTRKAFLLVRQGIQQRNLALLGKGATMSAEANQNILFKPLLAELKYWGEQRGAHGIIAAHSGTVLGLIYALERELAQEEEALHRAFPQIRQCWQAKLIQGGVKVVKPGVNPWRELTESQGNVWELRIPGF